MSQSVSPSISQPISQTLTIADHNSHSFKRTAQCNLALWISHTPRHPLELSVTLLATLSISFNPFCHVTFTHSRSTSHSLHSQAFCLSCHYLSRGSTHSYFLCAVPSDPVLSHGCYLTPLPISHTLTLTLMLKQKCLLSLSPSHTCGCPGPIAPIAKSTIYG